MKITLGDLRATGVRDLLVFCQDYRCSHNVKLPAEYVDRAGQDQDFAARAAVRLHSLWHARVQHRRRRQRHRASYPAQAHA
ncbi:hypothetical protein [Bradyrhizobium sp. CCBAU 45384]|uniref:hypothetical protein n=1 Tax=Bradyrhizobium sp. CCBAU 45384 TaxID=858428 RepID=UPI002304E869|nr:hypothetical protein [Bradyrhizobium sp. CCBAU 45384]